MNWENKWYLISGGSSGIGLQTAKDLTSAGSNVIIIGSQPEKTENALRQLPAGNKAICFDLRHIEKIDQIFSAIHNWGIRLDGMVHSAGICPLMRIADNDIKLMQDVFAVNYFSFLELSKFFQKKEMAAEKAAIVAVSSVTATQPANRQSVYASSKAALEQTVRCMAKEFLLQGIRVNAIALGGVQTELFQKLQDNTSVNLSERFPLGIIPMEYASKAIINLLSEDTAYMTGSIVKMDSGHGVWLR